MKKTSLQVGQVTSKPMSSLVTESDSSQYGQLTLKDFINIIG
jgi:hypothetical protein